MVLQLPDRVDKYFIKNVLLPAWNPSNALGYDPQNASEGDEAWLPVATTIDDVGAVYPSLIISYSNEGVGTGTTYDFLTGNGPGQVREGSLVATVRVQDKADDSGYTGDSSTHSAEPAEDVTHQLIAEVENVCQRRANGPNTEFSSIGSFKGASADDDTDEEPTVRIENCTITYSWNREA